MKKIFLDIETIPADESQHDILRELHEKKKSPTNVEKSFEDLVADSGMSGAFGRIFCICYAIDDGPVEVLQTDEPTMLKTFWKIAKDIDVFVGFSIFDFDLRFIWQRSVVHQIHPSKDILFKRYSSEPIYDVMYEWSRWSGGTGSRLGLHGLARAFNLPSSKDGEITGRTVYKAYKEGKFKEICDYCSADVTLTRSIYNKLNFIS